MPVQSINELIGSNPETGTGISNPELELGIPEPPKEMNLGSYIHENQRVEADLSSLPDREEKPSEVITKKESVVAEVFKEGGPFDQYLEQKTEKYEQLCESIDRHNEEIAARLGEEVPKEITDEDIQRSRDAHLNLEEEAENYEVPGESDPREYVDDLEKELEDDDEEVPTPKPVEQKLVVTSEIKRPEKEEPINPEGVSFDVDEEDFEDLNDSDDTIQLEKLSEEEILEALQKDITEKIAPVSQALDLRSFTRVKKGVRASKIVENVQKKVAEFPLMNAGSKIAMTDFSGTDIDALAGSDDMSRIAILTKRYTTLYNHIVSENKPESMESWVKALPYNDNDNVYMAAYAASFSGANYIPRDCKKCGNSFLTDNVPISEMYDFEHDEAQERFDNIMNGSIDVSDIFVVEDVAISDTICMTFRQPSVYNVLFENSYLDDNFAKKYKDVIAVLSYIDEICYIDVQTQSLIPIEYKRFPTNKIKDIKSRIIEYAKIINTLSPDQYSIIIAYINAINSRKNVTIKYRIPECKCPRCNAIVPEDETSAEAMVFMRHQLAALATTSIK